MILLTPFGKDSLRDEVAGNPQSVSGVHLIRILSEMRSQGAPSDSLDSIW